MQGDDYEPLLKKSRWGTNRYELNAANPAGAILIVLIIIVTAVVFFLMGNHIGPFAHHSDSDSPEPAYTMDSSWSEPPTP